MATGNLMLIDVDSQFGGGCQISVDYDTVALVVTQIHYVNTSSQTTADLTVTDNKGHTRRAHIPANTPPSTLTPPLKPGNWTPAMQANTDGGPPFVANGWQVGFVGWR
jgi:hypothetical protein